MTSQALCNLHVFEICYDFCVFYSLHIKTNNEPIRKDQIDKYGSDDRAFS